MSLKEIVGAGIVYVGIVASLGLGDRYADGYIIRISGNQTYVTAHYSTDTLVDVDGDGVLDKKYGLIVSRQGRIICDKQITDQDKRVFSGIVAKL